MKKVILVLGGVVLIALLLITILVINNSNNNSVSVSSSSSSTQTIVVNPSDLTITNEVLSAVKNSDGTVTVQYKYTITNLTPYTIFDVVATSYFNHSTPGLYSILAFTGDSRLNLNPNYNGMSDVNLLTGTNTIPPYATEYVYLTIKLQYSDAIKPFINYVNISGKAAVASSSSTGTSTSSLTSIANVTSSPTSSSTASGGTSSGTGIGTSTGTSQPTSSATSTNSGTSTNFPSSTEAATSSSSSLSGSQVFAQDQVTFDFSIESIPAPSYTGKGL